jgi:large subunit ribosomal protein L13e
VDHRRKNKSLEGLQANVQRLKTYKAKLVIFPRRARKVKVWADISFLEIIFFYDSQLVTFNHLYCLAQAGDSTQEELANATQVQGDYMPIVRGEERSIEVVKVTNEMKEFKAYGKLRLERTNKKHEGARKKRAAEAEKDEKK